MAVLVLVLAPALLQYNERSRAEKDNKGMDEVVSAIQLALADPGIYDELLPYSTTDNVSCYVDTNSEANYMKITTKSNPDGVDQYTFDSTSRQLDETPYFAAGNMRGITITFAPNKGSNGSTYDLKQGVVNQYVQVNGNQRVGALPELYNRLRSVVGDEIFNNSSTYKNSEYTIFIRLGTTGGNDADKQDAIVAYGQWSGTNLPAEVSYKLVSDRTVGDTGNTIVINDNKWNSENGNKITINPGDLNGGGSFDGTTSDGNQAKVGEIYAYLTDDNTLILRNSPRQDMSGISKDYGRQEPVLTTNHTTVWYTDANKIKTVNFETTIYPTKTTNWFKDCNNLSEIKNSKNLKVDYVDIMHGMFLHCSSLEYIDLGHWDTKNVSNFNCMFQGCEKLKSIDVSNWDTSNAHWISCMFYNCRLLESLDVSKWNTSQVEAMSGTFKYCESIKQIDVSKWNTFNVTVMDNMFNGCLLLEKIDVTHWDTSKVTNMSGMFRECKVLTYLDVSDWNTQNVTDMSYMFSGCNKLTNIDVKNWNVDSVTTLSHIFNGCSEFTRLDLSLWTLPSCGNFNNVFCNCHKLETTGDIEHWNAAGKYDDRTFQYCYALDKIPSWYVL